LAKANDYAYDVIVPLLSRRETHIVERLSELLRAFGIDPAGEEKKIRYYLSPKSSVKALRIVEELGLNGKQVVAVNISAGHDTRFWGVDQFRRLLQMLGKSYGDLNFLLLSKPEDQRRAHEIGIGHDAVAIAPVLESFDEFAAVIQRSSFLITPDTSAVHLAAAFGIPSVVLYVQSDKSLRIWDPYQTPTVSLVADVDDLKVISPEDVVQAFDRLISHPEVANTLLAPSPR
jgi:ADP-heptose:LPS heptosyltransferase